MKINNVIPFFAVFLLILMGCTQDEVIKEDTSVGGKEKISVTVTQGGAITRISHEDDGANGLILKWTANDAFKLYGTTTEVFTTTGPTDGDGKIATFTGNAVEDAQHAFFPASKAEKRWEDCHFNVIGQVIDANAPFAHLSGYNFMTAQTTASGTEISEISFKHKIAVLKFEVTLPDGIVPKYITLSTQDDAGIAISQKASDESNVTTAKQGSFSNDLQNFGFFGYLTTTSSMLIENIHIAANVTWSFASPEGTSYANLGVGGVIGNGYTQTMTVHNCTMSGEMQISDGSLDYGYLHIGSIVGHTTANIKNCSSIGKTNVGCKGGIVYIGGIVGGNRSTTNETKYCINTSSITLFNTERSNTNYAVSVGGIGGHILGKVLGCCNQGSITGHSLSSVDIGGIGGLTELVKCHLSRNLTTDFNVTSEETVRLGYLIGHLKNSTAYSCNESVGEQTKWIGSNPAWTPTTDDESAH